MRFDGQVHTVVDTRHAGQRLDNQLAAGSRPGATARLREHLVKGGTRSGEIVLIYGGPAEDDECVGAEEIPVCMIRSLGGFQSFESTTTRVIELTFEPKHLGDVRGRSGCRKPHRNLTTTMKRSNDDHDPSPATS